LPFANKDTATPVLNTVQAKLKFFDVKIFIISSLDKKGRWSSLGVADDSVECVF